MPRFRPVLPLKRAGRRDRIHPSTPSFPAIHQSANAWPRLACCHLPLPLAAPGDRKSYSPSAAIGYAVAPNRPFLVLRDVASAAEVE